MRVFLDTNVLVSAFASRGLCADLFELILLEHELIIGTQVLVELQRSMRGKIKLSPARSNEIVEFLREHATALVESGKPIAAPVDEDDARVIGEAIAGHAEVLVTGDTAIQRLGDVGQMRILSPRGFWDYLHFLP